MSSRRPNMSWTLTLELSVSIMWFYHVSNCELLTAPIFNSWYSKINQTLLSVIRWYFKYFDTAVHVWIIRPELSIDHRNLLSNNELMLRKEYSSSNSGPLPISSLSTLWGSGPGSEMDSKKNGGMNQSIRVSASHHGITSLFKHFRNSKSFSGGGIECWPLFKLPWISCLF